MLSIITGKAVTYFTLGFVILIIIAGGVMLIKNMNYENNEKALSLVIVKKQEKM